MENDYRRFCLNRELFPREQASSSNRLICGHLNRVKFQPKVDLYLQARNQGVSMRKAMAQASRCRCRGDEKEIKRVN